MRKPNLQKGHMWALWGLIALILFGTVAYSYRDALWPGGIGFGEDKIVTTSVETDKKGNLVKTVTTTAPQPGKTLWDWLSLLGVPLTLAILGAILQQQQQQRADQQAELEKQIAEANQQEEALQVYFDRLSTLLVEKNLLAIAARLENYRTMYEEIDPDYTSGNLE